MVCPLLLKTTSESGKALATYGKVAKVFNGASVGLSLGGALKDTYDAPDGGSPRDVGNPQNQKLETFAGSTTSAAVGAVGFEASVTVGASMGTILIPVPVYGTLIGGVVGGGAFIWKYVFDGGAAFVKDNTTNGLLQLNGKPIDKK